MRFMSAQRSLVIMGWALLLLLLNACQPTRRLAPGEQLFVGADIKFPKPNNKLNKRGRLKDELLLQVRPQANSPLSLWIHNLLKDPGKKKGFRYWLKYKLGKAPVLFQYEVAKRNGLVMEKYLNDQGYLDVRVQLDTIQGKQRVKSIYSIRANKRYRLRKIHWPDGDFTLDSLSRKHKDESKIKEGRYYNVDDLRKERQRLSLIATQSGYYGINQNDLYYYVDTSQGTDSLDLYVRWKPKENDVRMHPHRLGQTTVYATYSLLDDENQEIDTIQYDQLNIIEDHYFVHEKLLREAIQGRPGDLYDGRLQSSTTRYLQNLGIYKFINVRSTVRRDSGNYYLDRRFYLTPAQVRDLRFDFETNTRSGSYLGILAATSYSNKNWLGGAEQMSLNLSVGGETQVGNTNQFINTLELSAGASMSRPGILAPFKIRKIYREYVARTRLNLTETFQIRSGFFNSNRLSASLSYDWRTNQRLQHVFTPLSIQQNITFNIDPDFQRELDEDVRLRNSLEDVLIPSGQYRLVFSSQEIGKMRPYVFFSGSAELAGNIAYGIARLSKGALSRPYNILGQSFSQFLKMTADLRYYLQRRKRSWAFRIAGGLIAAYGNSEVAPYSKQFFIGGSNSLRAFRLRQLGPGNFVNPSTEASTFFDQTGDIKLEANVEYRFDIASYFEGAVFLDAGNIWLLNESIGENQEGEFQFNRFYREIALGSGLGLRIDLNLFIIRLDAAFPIHRPIADGGFEWTFGKLDLLSKSWRQDNLVWHLAIGYPF
ncbi:MAG: BamA/TamA family outer membrane protein [Bacteroidota bacterium]